MIYIAQSPHLRDQLDNNYQAHLELATQEENRLHR